MGSAITFSGFNDIDFNVVLNAIMKQESQPLVALQTRQSAMKSRATTSARSSTAHLDAANRRQGALRPDDRSLRSRRPATTRPRSRCPPAVRRLPARYEIVVNELARAQVTASSSSAPDADTTIVATGGSLMFGGHTVTLAGAVTLKQLAQTINDDSAAPVRASVVQAGPTSFRLVLDGQEHRSGQRLYRHEFAERRQRRHVHRYRRRSDVGRRRGGQRGDRRATRRCWSTTSRSRARATPSITVIPGSTITLFKKGPTPVVVDISEDCRRAQDQAAGVHHRLQRLRQVRQRPGHIGGQGRRGQHRPRPAAPAAAQRRCAAALNQQYDDRRAVRVSRRRSASR